MGRPEGETTFFGHSWGKKGLVRKQMRRRKRMGKNILVVDDEKEIADFVELYLKNENFNVYKFYNC